MSTEPTAETMQEAYGMLRSHTLKHDKESLDLDSTATIVARLISQKERAEREAKEAKNRVSFLESEPPQR